MGLEEKEIRAGELDLATILDYLKTPLTKSLKFDKTITKNGEEITIDFTNTAAILKIIFKKSMIEGSSKSEIIIKQGLEPEILKQFRPKSKSKANKMDVVFQTSDPKEIKKIMDMVKERFFTD